MKDVLRPVLRMTRDALRLYFQPLAVIDAALRGRPHQRNVSVESSAVPEVPDEEIAETASAPAEEQDRLAERLRKMAYSDSLTGLPNRRALQEWLESLMHERELAQQPPAAFAVVLIDLDRFKSVNDAHGHSTGDSALQQVAQRAKSWLPSGMIARLGGDELMAIIPDALSRVASEARMRELLDAIAKPISIAGVEDIYITASAGLVMWPKDGTDTQSLMRAADEAMYAAKNAGGNGYRFNDSHEVSEHDAIAKALNTGQLIAHYEAQLDLASNQIVAIEATIRWPTERPAATQPQFGLSLWARVEQAGLATEVGSWLLETAGRQTKTFHSKIRADLRLIVRIPRAAIVAPAFREMVEAVLQKCGLDARYLELVLDQDSVRLSDALAVSALTELSRLGVQIAINNFGPDHELWGDARSRTIGSTRLNLATRENIAVDMEAREWLRSIAQVNHTRQKQVVVVGVTNLLQLEVLRKIRCDAVQGPLLGLPVQAADFTDFLTNYRLVMPQSDRSRWQHHETMTAPARLPSSKSYRAH